MSIPNPFSPASRLLVLAALLLCSACASTGSTRTSLLSPEWRPPPGQTCEVSETPDPLPMTDALVDSAAVANALPDAPSNGYAIIELRFDTLTAEASTLIVESDLSDDVAAAALRAVSSNIRPQRRLRELPGITEEQERAFVGALLLRVGFDHDMSLSVGRSEECRPKLANETFVAGATSTLLAEAIRSNPGLAQSQVVVLEMQLDSTGRVVEAHVAESSGDTRADALALRVARLAVFHPAIINRKRSAVEVSFPVRLRVGRAPPRRGRRPR